MTRHSRVDTWDLFGSNKTSQYLLVPPLRNFEDFYESLHYELSYVKLYGYKVPTKDHPELCQVEWIQSPPSRTDNRIFILALTEKCLSKSCSFLEVAYSISTSKSATISRGCYQEELACFSFFISYKRVAFKFLYMTLWNPCAPSRSTQMVTALS